MKVGFSYGALSPPLEAQANKQGFTLGRDGKELAVCMKAIIKLRFSLQLPDGEYDKLLRRLNKKVVKSLKEKPKPGRKKK